MKKNIILISSVIGLLLSGCGTPPNVAVENGEEYYYTESSDGSIYLKDHSKLNRITKSTSLANDKEALKRELRIAAKITKKKGYSYFVILNKNVSNVNGFPINRFKELYRYISLHKRNNDYYTSGRLKKDGLIQVASFHLKFKPVTSKVLDTYISVWSVEQTLKDTQ